MKFVKLVKGKEAAAFDLPEELCDEVDFTMEKLEDNTIIFEKASQVYELEEENKS